MNITDRIRKVRQEHGLTIIELGRKLNVPDRTISNYERGERKPSVEYLTLLYEHLDANPEWLLSGRGDIFINRESKAPIKKIVNIDEFEFFQKENLTPSAGSGSLAEDESIEDYVAFKKEWVNKHIHAPQNAIRVLNVVGDSMEPTIKNGDLILVDISQNIPKSENIYVLRIDSNLVVKRIQILSNGLLQITSDNKMYDPYTIDLECETTGAKIIGKVVWFGRNIELF